MNMIFSADENWGIGKGNRLLYRIPPDMRRFKEKTTNGVVVMGRKTLESLPGGAPLANRTNIVLTRHPDGLCAGVLEQVMSDDTLRICTSQEALFMTLREIGSEPERTWVIGGAEILALLAPYCQGAYVTRIEAADREADCHAIRLDTESGWELAETGELQEWEGLRYRFDRYRNQNVKSVAIYQAAAPRSRSVSD
ncbi:MAG: dihydrofolate reductase [Clostridiales bacterium]|nr:dihydrofolate reductase [Clostridiales bacterium]